MCHLIFVCKYRKGFAFGNNMKNILLNIFGKNELFGVTNILLVLLEKSVEKRFKNTFKNKAKSKLTSPTLKG